MRGRGVCKCQQQRGAALAELLEEKISVILEEDADLTRADVVEAVASQGGIEPGTVNEILDAQINAPPVERLQAFADVLGLAMSEIEAALAIDVEAAEEDTARAASDPAGDEDGAPADDQRAGARASEEMLDALANIERETSRLRQLIGMSEDQDVVEIVDEQAAAEGRAARVRRAARAAESRSAETSVDRLDTAMAEMDDAFARMTSN